ncbi:type II toxin-antitoxin system VapC family toxin [Pseudactinotalea sp. Z1732]|uniref:type II toxin-antitoxin system VapC family toxin n=1 Tax=Micrococcales TaxID=85006 RepID=UPI003C7CB45C
MRYLLDTHALLWALTKPATLSPTAHEVIVDRGTTLLSSAASAWEVATKSRLGRLPQATGLLSAWDRNLQRLGCEHLPITDEHAMLAGSLDWVHRDPFDRMLAAQAISESLVLITRDPAFGTLRGVRTLW